MAKIQADIFGTLTHWQCGYVAGKADARVAEVGDRCPATKDFADSVSSDYIRGYQFGWEESPYTVAEIKFGSHGPAAPVFVRGYNSKAALERAIRSSQCSGV